MGLNPITPEIGKEKNFSLVRRVWRYHWSWRDNQNPAYIKEEQTTQWPKEKEQKDKQRSTKHTHKNKDRVTRTPLKIGGELRCSGRVSSSCSTSGTRRVNLITIPVISHELGKDREVFTSGTYQGRIQRGAHPARAPPKIGKNIFFGVKSCFFTRNTPNIFAPPFAIGKNMIFWRKIVIFHTKYPKYFRASLRSTQFF